MRSFDRIKQELGGVPIYYVEPDVFAALAWDIENDYGGAEVVNGVMLITVGDWVKGWARYGTYWHELGHHLYPSWPEWKVRLWGYIMAHRRGGLGTAEYLCGHTLDELPPRSVLKVRAQRRAKRMNGRQS